jgi:hypothetical protein
MDGLAYSKCFLYILNQRVCTGEKSPKKDKMCCFIPPLKVNGANIKAKSNKAWGLCISN